MQYNTLWHAIENRLDIELPHWRARIDNMKQLQAIRERQNGKRWSDSEVFAGFIKAILSSNVDWMKIENILGGMDQVFCGYDIKYYSELEDTEIETNILDWFSRRRANSLTLRKNLKLIRELAIKLLGLRLQHGSLEDFLSHISKISNQDPIEMALMFGGAGSDFKLPGIGVAIAAEALKNLGFDVAKPDRHINRALASLGLVTINTWYIVKNGKVVRSIPKTGYAYPFNSKNNCKKVMKTAQEMAISNNLQVTLLDNAIWLLCANSGLHYTNESIMALCNDTTV